MFLARVGGRTEACRRYCQVRLDLGADAYAGIACWRGEQHWVEIDVRRAYKARYQLIRYQLVKGGVTLDAVLRVATEMAKAAKWRTGQESRLSVAVICGRTGLGRRTVSRARTCLRLLGVATEVLRGRQRTKAERMGSWRLGDKARGWASVYALHPVRPVDKTRDNLGRLIQMAHHPRRGRFWSSNSRREVVTTNQAVEIRAASRRPDQRLRRSASTPDREGVVLAVRWLRSHRSPLWAREFTVAQWAGVLAEPAAHGWTGDDLNDILDAEARRLGKPLTPENPRAFMRWLLARHDDLHFPPHLLDMAAREQEAAEREEQQRAAAAEREAAAAARTVGRAAVGGAGYRAAMAATPDARAARRQRREVDAAARAAARAELVDRQRREPQ